MASFTFPPEFVNPKDKEAPEYGLQYAQAMYYTNNRYGVRHLGNNPEFDTLMEIAQGRQSVDSIKKLFGFYRAGQPRSQDGPDTLVHIDPQVLNLAPKYINRAVAKMQQRGYDIALESIDLLSVNEKKDYASLIRAFYRLREWVQMMGMPLQQAFPDIDVSSMPETSDELMYDINTNPKLKKEIAGELGLKLVMSINNFKQKMREADWYMVVLGIAHTHVYQDYNGVPRVDAINPKFWGGSYVENDDFEQQEYAFFLESITVNQFIRETSQLYDHATLMKIIEEHSEQNASMNFGGQITSTLAEYDNLNYITVMRFYFRSCDNRNITTRVNQYGSLTYMDRPYDWKPSSEVMERVNKKEVGIIRTEYDSVYGGTWILNSDVVYNYERKRYPRTNLVEQTLPIKTFAPNYKEGRRVSFLSQMIEPLYMINVTHNKIKAILAKEWMGQREVDLDQLQKVALGKGGNEWTTREVWEYLEMSNTLLKRGAVNQFGQSNGSALNFVNTGVQLADYFSSMSFYINMLENMVGATAIEQTNIPNRLGKSVMEQSQITGDMDMEYLYNGHEYLYEKSSHQLMLMMQQAKRDKKVIRGFVPALGKIHTGMYEVEEEVAYTEYGMLMSRQPSQQEWADFYVDVQIALKDQRIGPADSAFVREIDNLKQARQVLANREVLWQKRQMKEKQMDIQANVEAQQMSAEQTHTFKLREIEAEKQAKKELAALQGQIDQLLQNQKAEQDAIINNSTNQMKLQISKQTGADDIMKQAVRNTVEKLKVEKREDKSPED